MSAIAAAFETLFADPNVARDAVYTPQGGQPVGIRVVARRPDRVLEFGDTRIMTESTMFDVRVAEVAEPRSGDSLAVDGDTFVVQGEPVRDAERLIWTVGVRPA